MLRGHLPLAIRARLFDYSAMNLTLHSQRLTLAPYTPEDRDLDIAMWTDPAVVKYAGKVMSEPEIEKKRPNWTRRGGDGCIGIWTIEVWERRATTDAD
jgi:hypothetical protein